LVRGQLVQAGAELFVGPASQGIHDRKTIGLPARR
jgi:hypothetical protein